MQLAHLYSVSLSPQNQDSSEPMNTAREPKYYCFFAINTTSNTAFFQQHISPFQFLSKKLSDQNLNWICHRRRSSAAIMQWKQDTGEKKQTRRMFTQNLSFVLYLRMQLLITSFISCSKERLSKLRSAIFHLYFLINRFLNYIIGFRNSILKLL